MANIVNLDIKQVPLDIKQIPLDIKKILNNEIDIRKDFIQTNINLK